MSSLTLRRGLYYLYVLLFLITAPLVVLYTAGYRFDFQTHHFVKTGALSVATEPKNAQIILNDETQFTRTPNILKNVIPGVYTLRFTKADYHDWMREIQIASRQTTVVEGISLFLDAPTEHLFDSAEMKTAGPSDTEATFLYVNEGASWFEVWQGDNTGVETLRDRVAVADGLTSEDVLRQTLAPTLTSYHLTPRANDVLLTKKPSAGATPLAILPAGKYRDVQESGNLLLLFDPQAHRLVLVDTNTQGPPILLNTMSSYFHWTDNALVYGDGLEVHVYNTATLDDALITRSGDTVRDAWLINPHTFLLTFENRIVAYDVSDPARPVTTTLADGSGFIHGWVSENKKIAYLFVHDSNAYGAGGAVLRLPLQK